MAGVRLIVDVRVGPTPIAPDLDRRALERLATEAELGYRWMGANLGAPRDDAGSDDAAADSARTAFAAGIEELAALSRTNRTVVLCSEASPDRCRRALLIAPALRERGIRVVHILGDGAMRPDQPRLPLEGAP